MSPSEKLVTDNELWLKNIKACTRFDIKGYIFEFKELM
jgi:hypothetical protein